MESSSVIETSLQFEEGPTGDQDVKGAAPESSALPEMREEILRDDEMACRGLKLARVVVGERPIAGEEGTLSDGTLRRDAPGAEGGVQGLTGRVADLGGLGRGPGIVWLLPALPIEGKEPMISLPAVLAAPGLEFGPVFI